MTLISFFDPDPLDNIGDILIFQPTKCIFIGESSVINRRQKNNITRFLQKRNMDVQIEYQCIPTGDKDEALDRLARLAGQDPNCVFDVSGGTEMLITLAGFVADRLGVPIYQRRIQGDKIIWQMDCDLEPEKATLSIEEVVQLHSGMVLDSVAPPRPDEPAARKISKLWDIARSAPAAYNDLCTAFAFCTAHNRTTEPLKLSVDQVILSRAPGSIDKALLEQMSKAGLIFGLRFSNGGLQLEFSDYGIRDILTKAGYLLELVACMAGSFADDRALSISMDWDGILNDSSNAETKNELDVMLTVGLIPVCISCKNGNVNNEALYELDTVSRHFAGNFAKRILFASYVNHSSHTVESRRQRAIDMGIIPMFDVHKYSIHELSLRMKALLGL